MGFRPGGSRVWVGRNMRAVLWAEGHFYFTFVPSVPFDLFRRPRLTEITITKVVPADRENNFGPISGFPRGQTLQVTGLQGSWRGGPG